MTNLETIQAKRLESAMDILKTVTETVVAVGPDGAPEGTLYACMMSYTELPAFQRIMHLLKGAGLITIKENVVRATPRAVRAHGHKYADLWKSVNFDTM